jgi:ankyrin repeat protein
MLTPPSRVIAGLFALSMLSAPLRAGDVAAVADAVRNRDPAAARALVKRHANVNAPRPDGATALHWAAHWDDIEIARLLIAAGAKVDAVDDNGVTPLSIACVNGSERMAQALLEAGADANAALPSGETVLMTAANSGSASAVAALLAHGAAVERAEAAKGQNALMWAASEGHADVVRVLLDHAASLHGKSTSGFTPLLFASREGHLDVARLLIERGADVNEVSRDGTSPLLAATVRGHAALAEFLLDHGADPNGDKAGFTALHWAAGTWDSTLTSTDNGVLTSEGEWSVAAGLRGDAKLAFVKTLLAHGANPNAAVVKNPPRFGFTVFPLKLTGATPFMLASMAANTAVMRLLLDNGADPTIRMADRNTPLLMAAGIGRVEGENSISDASALEAVKLLLDLGASLREINNTGDTPMHAAAYAGANIIIEFLLSRGAELNPKNIKGETPLKIAEGHYVYGTMVNFHTNFHTVELLKRLGAAD